MAAPGACLRRTVAIASARRGNVLQSRCHAKVLAYRHQLRQIENCEDCIGYVALLRASDINRKVWLQVSEIQ